MATDSLPRFGRFGGFESALYEVAVTPGLRPERLIVPMPHAGSRDFVFVPDEAARTAVAALAKLSYSNVLGANFQYVDASHTEVQLGPEVGFVGRSGLKLRFAIVRWNRNSPAPFPSRVFCVAGSSILSRGKRVFEIIESNHVATFDQGGDGK